MKEIVPSLLSANFTNLGKDISALEKNDVKILHLDVMDGKFVPNISFGIPIINSIRLISGMKFDIHLMIDTPSKYVVDFVNAGADFITFHVEAETHIDRTVNAIKHLGCKAGVALNPATPINVIEDCIEIFDMVLIMSVNPGFGGQKFVSYTIDKVKKLDKLRRQKNPNLIIEVDGGIGKDNVKLLSESGCNLFVAGSSVFKNGNVMNNLKALRCELND